jgi:hypothetical protein
MTIQALINKIFRANQTQNNTVSWSGSNGLKSIQEDIVDTIRQRTFFTVPSTIDLTNQGFSNAVLCYVQDNAFYRWEPSGIPNGTTIFPANDGGVWVQETIGDTDGTVTSIGLSMPAAFTVANSPVTTSGVIGVTANGTSAQYIKGDGTLGTLPTPTGGTVTNVSALTLNTSGTDLSSTVANPTTTPVITLSVPTASAVNRGVLSPTDWSTFNGKQDAITLTTTGTSGAATLVGSTLNIPQYQSVITNPVTGTGTTNYLSKWTSSSSLNNSLVYDDGTNVGIGTTSPSYKLDVNGNTRLQGTLTGVTQYLSTGAAATSHYLEFLSTSSTNSYLNLRRNGGANGTYAYYLNNGVASFSVNNGTGETQLYSNAGGFFLTFYSNGSEAMRIPTTRNVLIGTTTDSGHKLQVNGTAIFYGSPTISVSNLPQLTFNDTLISHNWVIRSNGSNLYFIENGSNRIWIGGTNSGYAGNVGIGTTSTSYKLDVNGTSRIQNNLTVTKGASNYFTFDANTNTNDLFIQFFKAGAFETRLYTKNNYSVGALTIQNGLSVTDSVGSLAGFSAGQIGANFGILAVTNIGGNAQTHIASPSGYSNYVSFRENGVSDRGIFGYQNGTSYMQVRTNSATNMSNGTFSTAFFSSGNVGIGTTTDAGFKLDVNGTTRSQGKLTITTGGAEITGTVVAYTGIQSYGQVQIFSAAAFQMFNGANNSKASFQYINANGLLLTTNSENISGVLKGLQVNPTMVASANNNVLVGLDITPTFTNGAFTGVSNWSLRVNSGASSFGGDVALNGNRLYIGSIFGNTVLRPISTTSLQLFNSNSGAGLFLDANGYVQIGQSNAVNWAYFSASGHTIYGTTNTNFFTSGNVGINQGTDAGYKLDVNGTARVSGTTTLSTLAGTGTRMVVSDATGVLSTQAIPSVPAKSYGAWQDNATQTAAASNTGYGVRFNVPDITGYGVTVQADSLGNNTLIKMANAGTYNIQFSFQFENADNAEEYVYIWLRKNGQTSAADIPASNTIVTIHKKSGSTPGNTVAAWNFFVEAAANDFFQIVWATTDATNVTIPFYAATAFAPSTPSTILTVNQVN